MKKIKKSLPGTKKIIVIIEEQCVSSAKAIITLLLSLEPFEKFVVVENTSF